MRKLLGLFAIVAVTVAGAGWYLGWYRVSTTAMRGGHRDITVDINTVKVAKDLEKGAIKFEHMIENNQDGPGKTDGAMPSDLLVPPPPLTQPTSLPELIKEGATLTAPH